MRFLDTRTCAFVDRDPRKAKFAILSHTWDEGGEQSYKELKKIQKWANLKVQCPRHATKNNAPPFSSPPKCPPDTSPLPIPTEGFSSASVETPLRNPSESHADEITTPQNLHSMEGEDSQGDASVTTNARGSCLS